MKRRLAQLGLAAALGVLGSVAAWLALSPHGAGEPPAAQVSVLFATNRDLIETGAPAGRFGGRRAALRYGECTVGYRPLPLTPDLARSVNFFLPTDVREIESVSVLDRGGFEHELGKRGDGPVVLFVHGYAYGFPRTCRVGAELQRMVGDDATIVMFGWPSDGNPAGYVADRADVEWSVPDLAGLIDRLGESVGPGRLRLLAHSLGTRGVLAALDELALAGREPPYAGHLVLLAPDFDTARFRHRHDRLQRQVGRITLYASRNDTPLRVSETLHGHPRLGQAGDHLTVIDGMTTIDVSPLGRYHPSGHEYFFYHPIAADDLVESLIHARPPGERRHTRARSRNGDGYWVLVQPEEATQ